MPWLKLELQGQLKGPIKRERQKCPGNEKQGLGGTYLGSSLPPKSNGAANAEQPR